MAKQNKTKLYAQNCAFTGAAESCLASGNTQVFATKMESARHRRRPSGLKFNNAAMQLWLGVAFVARRVSKLMSVRQRLSLYYISEYNSW